MVIAAVSKLFKEFKLRNYFWFLVYGISSTFHMTLSLIFFFVVIVYLKSFFIKNFPLDEIKFFILKVYIKIIKENFQAKTVCGPIFI